MKNPVTKNQAMKNPVNQKNPILQVAQEALLVAAVHLVEAITQ